MTHDQLQNEPSLDSIDRLEQLLLQHEQPNPTRASVRASLAREYLNAGMIPKAFRAAEEARRDLLCYVRTHRQPICTEIKDMVENALISTYSAGFRYAA